MVNSLIFWFVQNLCLKVDDFSIHQPKFRLEQTQWNFLLNFKTQNKPHSKPSKHRLCGYQVLATLVFFDVKCQRFCEATVHTLVFLMEIHVAVGAICYFWRVQFCVGWEIFFNFVGVKGPPEAFVQCACYLHFVVFAPSQSSPCSLLTPVNTLKELTPYVIFIGFTVDRVASVVYRFVLSSGLLG